MYHVVFGLVHEDFSRTKGLLNKSMWFPQLSFRKILVILSDD